MHVYKKDFGRHSTCLNHTVPLLANLFDLTHLTRLGSRTTKLTYS